MAQVELTAEQQEMWQNAITAAADFGGRIASSTAQQVETTLEAAAPIFDRVNHVTPGIFPGNPMTTPLSPVLTAIGDGLNNAIQNVANPVAILVGETPAEMMNNMAGMEQFQTEDGRALLDIMEQDTEFTTALHAAITRDPSVSRALLGNEIGGEEGAMSMPALVSGLQDPATREKFTSVLNAVAESPDDNLNFDYMSEVAQLSQLAASGQAEQQDYQRLQYLLGQAGVQDFMLDMAADPMATFQEMMNDPTKFFDQLATQITATGPIADMLRGLVQGMGQYMELVVGGEMGAVMQAYVTPLINDAPNFAEQMGWNMDAAEQQAPATETATSDLGTMPTMEEVRTLASSTLNETETLQGSAGNVQTAVNATNTFNQNALNTGPASAPEQEPQNAPAPVQNQAYNPMLQNTFM